VAEIEPDDRRQLIGVGRLVADADHTDAEYAVLVADAYQGIGLGALLTDFCLDICRAWGIGQVFAETGPDNRRMIGLLQHHKFELDRTISSDVVLAKRRLN
jgi:acetyltransferase